MGFDRAGSKAQPDRLISNRDRVQGRGGRIFGFSHPTELHGDGLPGARLLHRSVRARDRAGPVKVSNSDLCPPRLAKDHQSASARQERVIESLNKAKVCAGYNVVDLEHVVAVASK